MTMKFKHLLKIIITLVQLFMSVLTYCNCREPDLLPALNKTADDLSRETRMIIPGQLKKIEFMDNLNITRESIGRKQSCKYYIQRKFANDSSEPVSTGSTCPWYYVKNTDTSRIPREITEAECACRCCGQTNCQHTRCSILHQPNLCQKVYTYTTVLRRTGCVNGIYEYSKVIEPISVGCTCVRCPLPITRGMKI